MIKSKKTTALLIAFILIISFVISPFSVVNASGAPDLPKSIIKPPSQNLPTKLPEITKPDISITKPLEKPAKAQGVNYETKEGIKRIPTIQNIHRGMGSSSNPEC